MSNAEGIIIVLSTLLVLAIGFGVIMWQINERQIRENTEQTKSLKYLVDSIIEIFENRYKYEDGKDEDRGGIPRRD